MKELTASEMISLTRLLRMETNGLAMAKAGVNVISDTDLKSLAESGIIATEGRIKGMQQFISDNNVTATGGAQ